MRMESTTKLYSFNRLYYRVTDSEEVHASLCGENSDAFADYLRRNVDRVELLGVIENSETNVTKGPVLLKQNPEQRKEYLWTPATIKLLLEEYKKRIDAFRSPVTKKIPLWKSILKVFEQNGYDGLSAPALDEKMRAMKKTFKRINSNVNTRKTKKGASKPWEYFNEMAEIFPDDVSYSINETNIVGSSMFSGASNSFEVEPDSPLFELSSNQISTPVSATKSQSSQNTQKRRLEAAKGRILETEDNVSQIKRMRRLSERINLDEQRRHNLELEKDRVETLHNILAAVEQSNSIQKERNELLKQLIQKM